MQNKANFHDSRMIVTPVIARDYLNLSFGKGGKNKANTNPIQSQFKPNSKPIKAKTNPNKANLPNAQK